MGDADVQINALVYCDKCGRLDEVSVPRPDGIRSYAVLHDDHILIFAIDPSGTIRSTYVCELVNGGSVEVPVPELNASVSVPRLSGVSAVASVIDGHAVVVYQIDGVVVYHQVFRLLASRPVSDEFLVALKELGPNGVAILLYGALTLRPVRVSRGALEAAERIAKMLDLKVEVSEGEPTEPPAPFLALAERLAKASPSERVAMLKRLIKRVRGTKKLLLHVCRYGLPDILIRDLMSRLEPLESNILLEDLKSSDSGCYQRVVQVTASASQ